MDWKKLGRELLFPPVWLLLILVVLSAAALSYVFIYGLNESAIAYVAYIVSFYTLITMCAGLWLVIPKQYKEIKQAIYNNPLGKRYMTDVGFKNHISLYSSLFINLLYVGTNIFSAFLYGSVWSGIFAMYYTILAVMRFLLIRYINKHRLGRQRLLELRCARICAAILTTVNLVMTGVVPMILYQNKGFEYHGMLIYVMAMYTFYMTASAIAELIKYRRYDNPVLSTSKVIKTAAALVSMLSLETAMFSQFGGKMPIESQHIMIIATGAGISLIVTAMAIYMIVSTSKEIKEIRRQNRNG